MKKAFSLTETMIILVIMAIAIAAATPIISKKIVNIVDSGETLSGDHGRYEVFAKEIITYPDPSQPDGGSFEKTTDPDIDISGVGGGSGIIVFKRLTDAEYKSVKGTDPQLSSDGVYKSTLYEQINDATIYYDSNGIVEFVEFKDRSNISKKYPVGGNIIVENANVVYKKGVIDTSVSPKTFRQTTGIGAITLPNRDNRIIEGRLVDYHGRYTTEPKNDLWHIDANSNKNDGDIDVIPWERLISDNKPIIDRPIAPTTNPTTGEEEYIGSFTPSEEIKNAIIHAVGGGGAGGGITDTDLESYVQSGGVIHAGSVETIRKILAQRIREVAKTKSCNVDGRTCAAIAGMSDSDLVGTTSDASHNHVGPSTGSDDYGGLNGKWAMINTAKGTISVLADTRFGMIYPHELLRYTKVIGTDTQKADIYQMPKWFTWEDINAGKFWLYERVQSGKGGKGGTLSIQVPKDTPCIRTQIVEREDFKPCDGPISHCHDPNCGCYDEKDNLVGWGCCCSSPVEDLYYCPAEYCKSAYSKDTSIYNNCYKRQDPASGCNVKQCTSPYTQTNESWCVWTNNCNPKFYGQEGGNGTSGVVCHKATSSPINYSSSCKRQAQGTAAGGGGNSASTALCIFPTAFAGKGDDGVSCTTIMGGNKVSAGGGIGGAPYRGAFDAVEEAGGQTFLEHANYCHSMTVNGRAKDGDLNEDNDIDCSQAQGKGDGVGLYNYAFIWTIPYAINTLSYGEGGNAGEYASTKVSSLNNTQTINITLGLGGVWNIANIGNGENGPNGGDTTVDLITSTTERILLAKGGKGGQNSLKTDSYDLCFAKSGTCPKGSGSGVVNNCCDLEQGSRSTNQIIATSSESSLFDFKTSAFAGKSLAVGIGGGRGGEGIGSRAGEETLFGARIAWNSTSASGTSVINESGDTRTPPRADYKNARVKPSSLNFKGGDGAVIIAW